MSQSTLNQPNEFQKSASTRSPSTLDKPLPPDNSPYTSRVTTLDRWLLKMLQRGLGNPEIDVRLWDHVSTAEAEQADVVIRDRATLCKLFYDPSVAFGEGYSAGRIDVYEDLVTLCNLIDVSMNERYPRQSPLQRLQAKIRYRYNTQARSKKNIHSHYDIGNDFYSLWLDEQLVYTCAYFAEPDSSLEDAQIAKMDHVCRKVRLKPGDTVVEAGCGWGALALHMARKYGVNVKAFNISREQILYARQRAEAEGFSQQVEFIEDDWRNITGEYDAFLSVGMLEHVGPENYKRFGQVIANCLKPTGLGLIHTIGRNLAMPLDTWTAKRIFPGAYPPSLRQMTDLFESSLLSVLDVENLRLHYAKTLTHWLKRFEQNLDAVQDMFDESFVRTWRLYLAASVAAFLSGSLQLFQATFAHTRNNQIPLSREYLYSQET